MREFTFLIEEALNSGLREDGRGRRDGRRLVVCRNARPTRFGLKGREVITLPFASTTVSWPFPQLLRGSQITLMAYAASLKQVSELSSPWTETSITTYNCQSWDTAKAIATGGVWHMADMGETWFLFNGSCVVFKHHLSEALSDGTDHVLVQDEMTINTGCYHRGRLVIGGFNPDDFWGGDWKELWTRWQSTQPDPVSRTYEALLSDEMPIPANFVQWSTIGGGDTLFWFMPHLATTGAIGRETIADSDPIAPPRPFFFDFLERNEMGFLPMSFQGIVQLVKPLGRHVIVYGEDGMCALTQVSDPTPTYGFRKLAELGVAGRGAVGGDDSGHLILDREGYAWFLNPDLQLRRLGYKEFLSDLVDSRVVVTHDPSEGEYYIANGAVLANPFVIGEKGMGEVNQLPTSLYRVGGVLAGIYKGGSLGDILSLTSDTFDLGNRGIKVISDIEVGLTMGSGVTGTATLYYRNGTDDSFSSVGPRDLNGSGVAFFDVGGIEFRVGLSITGFSGTEVDYIVVRWKQVDKRFTRGQYVAQTNAGTG